MKNNQVHTLPQLISILNTAITQGQGNLIINDQLVAQIPALGKLLLYLAKSTLTINGAILSSTLQYVYVSGTAFTLSNKVNYNVVLTGCVANGEDCFVLQSVPVNATTWTFADNFAPLPDYYTEVTEESEVGTQTSLTYQTSFFNALTITNPVFSVATYTNPADNAIQGLTFSGILNATVGPFAPFSDYLPGSNALALSGTIEMTPNTFPLIDLQAPVINLVYPVQQDDLANLFLHLQTIENPNEDDLEDYPFVSSVRLGGQLSLNMTEHLTFVLEAPMLQSTTVWRFQTALDGEQEYVYLFSGKEALAGFLGNSLFPLPPAMTSYSNFYVEALEFAIVPAYPPDVPSVRYVRATVGTAPWSPPIPNIKIDKVAVAWTFNFYSSLDIATTDDTQLSGTLAIGEGAAAVHLDVLASVPEFNIEAEMRFGETLPVAQAISWFTGKQVNLGTLSIIALNLWAEPDAQSYTFFAEVEGQWPQYLSVPAVDFTLLNLYIYYTPNSLNAVISANVTLGGKEFSVRAATPASANEGWLFSGGLMPGQSFSLGEFLSGILPSGWTVPPSIAAIELTALYLSFDTQTKDYLVHVKVEWEYPIVGYTVSIAAELLLQAVHKAGTTEYSGRISGDFMVNNLAIKTSYAFNPSSETITFEIAYKQRMLRAELVTTHDSQKLAVDFPDLSLGEMLTYLVNLAAPGSDFSLPAPWDALNQVAFNNIQLVIDLQTNEVTIKCDVSVDLYFVAISSVSLTYTSTDGVEGVELALSATFFGKEYSIEYGDPLAWDVLNEPAPTVPAKGSEFLDLRYLGFGQHISFSGSESAESIDAVLTLMKAQLKPVADGSRNPLALGNGSLMRFDRSSHFLIGAQFSVLQTVGISMIFNDPYLYGMALDLMGPRVGAFAGLHFELLYQRVSNDLGVFKVILRVPDQFRQFEIGALSVTLPVIKLDVYTDGNFRVDLGFPTGGDFSDSFALQLFPFVGNGGFYFGWLSGDSSTSVPQITNGSFDPVVEFGIGLHVGMGKSISKGPLSGGLSIVVEGIVEGTLAWFTPRDRAQPDGKYYRVEGAVGIVGKLYGRVDFAIIKASVSVEASVLFTLLVESFEPITMILRLRVRVSASITILFVTVSFSFNMELVEEFVIGSPGNPPWILAAPEPPTNSQAIAASLAYGVQPRLRLQRGRTRRRSRAAALLRQAFSQAELVARLYARTSSGASLLNWTPVKVVVEKQNLAMFLLPSFTVATPRNSQDKPSIQIALTLTMANSVSPSAAASAEDSARPVVEHSARAATPPDAPFNLLLSAMLKWSIYALLGNHPAEVTVADLELLKQELEGLNAGPSYDQLSGFFSENFKFLISGVPNNLAAADQVGSTLFPMIPALSYTAPNRPPVDFATQTPVNAAYEEYLYAYYNQLLVDYDADRAGGSQQSTPLTALAPGADAESMAALIFEMYFLMLARSAVQAALDLMQSFQYVPGAQDSLNFISGQFPSVEVPYQVKAGDTIDSICDEFGMTVAQLEALNDPAKLNPLVPGTTITVQLGVTPQTIAASNQTAPLQEKTPVNLSGILYQVRDGDALTDLASTFYQSSPAALLDNPTNQQNPLLLRQGSSFLIAEPDKYTYFTYTSVPGDYLDLVAALVYVRVSPAESDANLAWYKQTIADLNVSLNLDLSGVIPPNIPLKVPPALNNSQSTAALTYNTHDGDTLDLVARYVLILQTRHAVLDNLIKQLQELNPSIDWNKLSPGTAILVPAQTRIVQAGDTFASLAGLFGISNPASLAGGPNANNKTLLAPLAVLQMPDVRFLLTAQDTLASLADRFNLPLSSLASDLATVAGLFVSSESAPLLITNLPRYGVNELAFQIINQGKANQASGMVSRFMTSGLQLPVPTNLSTYQGMYELTGQQLPYPPANEMPYKITFTRAAYADWIEFVLSEISTAGQRLADLLARAPRVVSLNPGVDWTRSLPGGLHLLTTDQPSLTLFITPELLAQAEPALVFDPQISGPVPMQLFQSVPLHYALQTVQHWQTPAPPAFVGLPSKAPLAGEPTIWTFPAQLMQRVAETVPNPINFSLLTSSAETREGKTEQSVERYDWASLIEIRLRQIIPTDGDGSPARNSYEFMGTDQEGRELLSLLFSYLKTAGNAEDGTKLYLLFQPNADSNNTSGFASEIMNISYTFIVKTNLSTLTTSGDTALQATTSPYAAKIDEPAKFLQLLWEASVTNTGGYTLHYSSSPRNGGLPTQVFAASNEARLSLLVVLGSQSNPAIANRKLYPFNNCAIIDDNIDPSTQNVFVLPSEVVNQTLLRLPTVPPGNVGFELDRVNPNNASNPLDLHERITLQLYSLLGYQVAAGGNFTASHLGVPVTPTEISPQQTALWHYDQILSISQQATSTLPPTPGLPSPSADPYAGIAANSQVNVDLTFYDLYGNYIAPRSPLQLRIPAGYTDDLIGLAEWPGITTAYDVLTQNQAPLIQVECGLQVSNYMPASGNSFEAVMQSISAHSDRYSKIYYQYWQQNNSLFLTTSLHCNQDGTLYHYNVDPALLGNFINATLVFLQAAAQQQLARYTLQPNDTLESIAANYASGDADLLSATIAALGQVNRDLPTSEFFARNIQIPLFSTVAYGDTLVIIASQAKQPLTVEELAARNATVPLNAGVDITAPLRTTLTGPGNQLATLADGALCSVGRLAEANATRRGILTEEKQLTVNGVTVTVVLLPDSGETQSFTDLVAEFQSAGILVTPAQIAVANQTLTDLFYPNVVLEVRDYIIQSGDTFASLEAQGRFSLAALAAAAQQSPNIYLAGIPLYLQVFASLTPSQTTTLASLATVYGSSLEQLTLFNATTSLIPGKTLLLPDRVELDATGDQTFTPYCVQASTSLNEITLAFGEIDVLALCERNRTVRHLFQPGQLISAGQASITTLANDSLHTIWSRLHAQDEHVDFARMVHAIAAQASLLRSGAFLICALPTTPADSYTSLAALAAQFNLTPALLAQANSSLRYFVGAGVSVHVDGRTLTTHNDETFNSLVERFLIEHELSTSVTAIANQNAGTNLINSSITFLLPPRPVLFTVSLGQGYAQQPAFPDTIFRLTTELTIQRPSSFVAPDFQSMPAAQSNTSMLAPRSTPAQQDPTLSLWNFALAAENAFQNTIKLAISGKDQASTAQVWVVNFGPGGISSVALAGTKPNFFALPPLANKLIDASNVLIRSFNPQTGTLQPLSEAIKMNFQSVDMEVWAGIVLPAIDLLLSPAYAVPAYQQNSDAFTIIVKVKDILATSISQSLSNVLATSNPGINLADAQERLRQELLINLSRGYATDVLIQYTSLVTSAFKSAEIAPRLSGLPLSNVYQTGATDTLNTLAQYYQISTVSLAMLLGPVVRILNSTVSVLYYGQSYPLTPDDTLNSLMRTVGAADYQQFVDHLEALQGLFAPQTTLNLYETQVPIKDTVPVYTKDIASAPTFASIIEYFDAPLETVVVQNQERKGIFIQGVTVKLPGYSPVVVTAENNSLKLLAAQIELTTLKPCSPLDLARGIETETGLLNEAFTMYVVRYIPELNLAAMKTSLANGLSTVNTLLSLKSRGKQKKLLLDLLYRINELEYNIYTQPDTGGYQASSWLSFIIPIGADPQQSQVIAPRLGQIEIPLPLRSYPTAPLLLDQSFDATLPRPATVSQAKGWTYAYSYQHQAAPQDTFYLTSEFNLPTSANALYVTSSASFFDNMAQFISVYEEVKAKLTELLIPRPPTDTDTVLHNTLASFAEMVLAIANTWPVNAQVANADPVVQGTLTTAYSVSSSAYMDDATSELLLSTLTLTRLTPSAPPAPNGHFPDISWRLPGDEAWHPLRQNTASETAQQCVYSYQESVPAFSSIEYRLASPATSIIDVQNANSRVQLTRNKYLVSTGETSSRFIYTTAEIPFPNILKPFIAHDNLIPIRNGDESLNSALVNLFTTLLGPNAAAFSIRLSALFGYDLVSSSQNEVDPLVSLLPILFQPTIPYTSSFPTTLAAALTDWLQRKPLAKDRGLYVFDLMVYSTLTSTNHVPLLELKRLYYDLVPHATRMKRRRL